MNQLQTFNHSMFGELPVMTINGVEWFGATEAAKALSFSNPYTAISNHVDEDDLTDQEVIDRLGRKQCKKFVNESGLYSLIFGAARQGNNLKIKEEAKQFKRWVTSEVLPSIRKNGGYIMTDEHDDDASIMAKALLVAHKTIERNRREKLMLEEQIKQDQPYTNFGKIVSNSNGAISVGAFAKMLYDQHGLKIGRNKMFDWLRDNGYLMKGGREHNNPKQIYIQQGWFEVKPTIVSRTEGDVERLTTLITGKGQVKLAELLLKQRKVVS
ncbi:phage antirepressor KilAC domain-containing protein [Bacillus badius]|uniref:Phage antirepressor protein n=1 Tax=Bacillus badius TaxID=1455 RepID=A0ABR5AQI9_BACBA|nr:phage antirepressor KilAC domain-containing protein [Bacillus badius]KIL74177.1 Phage antirepressor protein [Bacillus badius]MED4718170.1 phage antirepressor KilAC domain-containing protein [Bacillus badius]